jgi:hypothetical protein
MDGIGQSMAPNGGKDIRMQPCALTGDHQWWATALKADICIEQADDILAGLQVADVEDVLGRESESAKGGRDNA